jgi:hypothetical protein
LEALCTTPIYLTTVVAAMHEGASFGNYLNDLPLKMKYHLTSQVASAAFAEARLPSLIDKPKRATGYSRPSGQ